MTALQTLKTELDSLLQGPELYEFLVNHPSPDWGLTPGKAHSLEFTDDDGARRSVLSWKIRDDGSVDVVRRGQSRI